MSPTTTVRGSDKVRIPGSEVINTKKLRQELLKDGAPFDYLGPRVVELVEHIEQQRKRIAQPIVGCVYELCLEGQPPGPSVQVVGPRPGSESLWVVLPVGGGKVGGDGELLSVWPDQLALIPGHDYGMSPWSPSSEFVDYEWDGSDVDDEEED